MSCWILSIQHDWDLTEKKKSFWINLYKRNGEKLYGEITCDDDGSLLPSKPCKEHMTIEHYKQNELGLTELHASFNHSDSRETLTIRPSNETFEVSSGVQINDLDISCNDSQLLISYNNSSACLMDLDTRRSWVRLEGHHVGEVYKAKFFPSGKVAITAGADTTMAIWDLANITLGPAAVLSREHTQGVLGVDFIEKGRNLISCSRDGTAIIWDVSKQQAIMKFDLQLGPVQDVSILQEGNAEASDSSIAGKIAILGADQGVLVDCTSQKVICKLKSHSSINCTNATSRDGMFVTATESGYVDIWDVRKLDNPWRSIECLTQNPIRCVRQYGKKSVVSAGDGLVHVVDVFGSEKNFMIFTGSRESVNGLACSSEHDNIYTGARDGKIRVYTGAFRYGTQT